MKRKEKTPRIVERRNPLWAKFREKFDSMDELATLHSVCRETTLYQIVPLPMADGEYRQRYDTASTTTPFKGAPDSHQECDWTMPVPLMIISEPSSDGKGVSFAGLGIACPNCNTKLMLPDEHICNYEYFLHSCPHCDFLFNYASEFYERVLERLSYYRQAYRFDKKKYLKERQECID